MKKLFDDLSYQVSKATTQKYSTSFSLGIMALKPEIRPAIYAIYGFVRLADEIVDSFHDYDKEALIARLRLQTTEALNEKISLNPILNSFQETVHKYEIGLDLIDQFLKSMEMDLNPVDYNTELYKEYILGSAEVVGLMCLKVFVEGCQEKYDELKPFAMKLGSAFQKVNFLRDLKDDYSVLGRTYFPNVDMNEFNNEVKCCIEKEIKQEFAEALIGIKKLPVSSRFGVYLAYRYYLSLLKKICNTPAQQILNARIRIPNTQKISLMMRSYVKYKVANV
ncbi:phytoene/squalene synthase family protein [Flavobacterium sp. AG291]|uniref:phytoene/squalene synthase family protein n=1 Tax=Flavobacterium sp. AG291 TaxID=2184000 RepID=UPI000E0A1F07|nr:phytoene/squalene synthase family protein [Flavobacterium sp. AG291]RDI14559.1 phytoene/squalene synthetase [Flavobacterium sp. AG291]